MIIREGGILGEALLVPDGEDLADLHEIANQMKENYGYHIDMIKAVETKSFSNRRHVCYPDDVMVVLFGMGMRPEQIWVRDILEEDYPEEICTLGGTKILHTIPDGIEEMTFVGAGRLINEPYNKEFGYHNGSVVPIYSLVSSSGEEIPIVPANHLWPRK